MNDRSYSYISITIIKLYLSFPYLIHSFLVLMSRNVMNTYGRYPIAISHGKGTKLYDLNGKEYIDFAAGIATCCLGYANPVLKKAVSDQMDRVHHCSNLYFIPEQAELAKWIVKNSCADKVRHVNHRQS